MKREFEVKLTVDIDLDSYDSLDTVKTDYLLKDDFHYPTHSDVSEMVVTETTHVDEVASHIASKLSEELDGDVEYRPRGDNGDEDIGYELVRLDGWRKFPCSKPRVLCDIGITKTDGTWSVFIENGDQNIEVTSVDDIVDYLGKELIDA